MITATLTYKLIPGGADVTITLPELDIPLTEGIIEGATDVQTLDNNVSTYFIRQKRSWSTRYEALPKDLYDIVRAVYDSQFTSFTYPRLSIPYYSIINVPVRMTLNAKEVWNNCGDVQNIQIGLRETRQRP